MFIQKHKTKGVAALITVITLGSLITAISLSTAIVTFWSIKNIDNQQKSINAYYAAYSGIQDALIQLERDKDFNNEYFLSVNKSNDVFIMVRNNGNTATIFSEAEIGGIHKRIETTVDLNEVTGLVVPTQTKEVAFSEETTTTTKPTTSTKPPPFQVCGDIVTFNYNGEEVYYGTVLSPTGKCWLDRNLGANRKAIAYNDIQAYGDLYQWGRRDDGHQLRTSGTTDIRSTTDNPGHSNFITYSSFPYDWRNPQNNNLWQGVNGINNPCPQGWRIPTFTELVNESIFFPTQNAFGAYNSVLKLPTSGYRSTNGTVYCVVYDPVWFGHYWSSTTDGSYIRQFIFDEESITTCSLADRSRGLSVRCVQD